jgi:hypothetical protein
MKAFFKWIQKNLFKSVNNKSLDNLAAIYRFLKESQQHISIDDDQAKERNSLIKFSRNLSPLSSKMSSPTSSVSSSASYESSNRLANKRLALKFLTCSVSVDEGVESDASSHASSSAFNNHVFSYLKPKPGLCLSKSANKEPNKTRSFDEEDTYSSLITIPQSSHATRKSNYHSLKSRRVVLSGVARKKFNPFDLMQVKRELKNLIKTNSPSLYSSTSTDISVTSNISKQVQSTYSSSSSVTTNTTNFNNSHQKNKLQSSVSLDFVQVSDCTTSKAKRLACKYSTSLCSLFEKKFMKHFS